MGCFVDSFASLEKLDFALVFLRGAARIEGAEIPALARLRVFFDRIQAVFP